MDKGSLSEKNVLELLIDFHRSKRSGVVYFKQKAVEKQILLREGAILRAQSNQETEKLGQVLVRKNLLSPWDLDVAATRDRLRHLLAERRRRQHVELERHHHARDPDGGHHVRGRPVKRRLKLVHDCGRQRI